MSRKLNRFYEWSVASLNSRWGLAVFALITFLNSSLLPVTPYIMLVPMCLAKPQRWLLYSFVAIVSSVLGGYLMWIVGFYFWEAFHHYAEIYLPFVPFERVPQMAQAYSGATFWTVVVAALSPVPYKFVSLACGLAHVNLWDFTIASIIGRGSRLAATAFLIGYGGPRARAFVQKWMIRKSPTSIPKD